MLKILFLSKFWTVVPKRSFLKMKTSYSLFMSKQINMNKLFIRTLRILTYNIEYLFYKKMQLVKMGKQTCHYVKNVMFSSIYSFEFLSGSTGTCRVLHCSILIDKHMRENGIQYQNNTGTLVVNFNTCTHCLWRHLRTMYARNYLISIYTRKPLNTESFSIKNFTHSRLQKEHQKGTQTSRTSLAE